MCWLVWENPKGVTNLLNRNIKQALLLASGRNQQGKQRGLALWPCDLPAEGQGWVEGFYHHPYPIPCHPTFSTNFLYWSPASPLGSQRVTENWEGFGVFSCYLGQGLSGSNLLLSFLTLTQGDCLHSSNCPSCIFPVWCWNIFVGSVTAAVCREMGGDARRPPRQPTSGNKNAGSLPHCWSVSLGP